MRVMNVKKAARPEPLQTRSLRQFAVIAVLLVLAACAPTTGEPGRVGVQQLSEPLSFYPRETGAQVYYVPDGGRLDGRRAVDTIEGPAVLDGEVWIVSRLVGLTQDIGLYRQFRDDGVYLRRQMRPGCTADFDPPMREFPAQTELRVGAIWSGSTEVTLVCPGAVASLRRQQYMVDYVYTVVDFRPVTVTDRRYQIYAIDRTTRIFDEDGNIEEEVSQQVWFAPHVGYVRDERGLLIVDANFPAGTRVE